MAHLTIPLPEGMEPYKDDLEYFVSTMVRKLHVNRHKGTSKELDVRGLMAGLNDEMLELAQAIRSEGQFDVPIEAADVANFAFLVSIAVWHMTRQNFEDLKETYNGRT